MRVQTHTEYEYTVRVPVPRKHGGTRRRSTSARGGVRLLRYTRREGSVRLLCYTRRGGARLRKRAPDGRGRAVNRNIAFRRQRCQWSKLCIEPVRKVQYRYRSVPEVSCDLSACAQPQRQVLP